MNVSSFLARSASRDECHRIWCSDQHWVLAVVTLLLAIGLKSWLSSQEKVESKKVEPVEPVELAKREESPRESPRELQLGEGDGDHGDHGDHQTAPLLPGAPGSPSKSKNQFPSFLGRKRTGEASGTGTTATAVAPEIPTESKVTSGTSGSTSGGDRAIRRSSKTAVNSASEAPNSKDENIQNSTPKEVEIRVASDSETNPLKSESKEVDLPAAGDKYPLGLARHLGWFRCCDRSYTVCGFGSTIQ